MLTVDPKLTQYRLAAGEPFLFEVVFQDRQGATIDLTGRRFVLAFYKVNAFQSLEKLQGELVVENGASFIRFARDGLFSEALRGQQGVKIELSEKLLRGRNLIATGALTVDASAMGLLSYDNGIIGRVAARATIREGAATTITYVPFTGNIPGQVTAPEYTTPASIASDGTPQVGETLTGVDGVATNTVSMTRRWLLGTVGTTVLATSNDYTPTVTGALRFQSTATGPTGLTTDSTSTVIVTALPTIAFAVASGGIAEGDTGTKTATRTLNVTRQGTTGALVVNFIYSGTATRNTDYTGPSSLTIADGANSVDVTVTLTGETTVEADETIVINASLAAYPTATASTTVTITNDDVAAGPTIGGIAINSPGAAGSYTEGYILSDGDDFDGALDIVTPAAPFARYSTTRGGYIVLGTGIGGSQQPRTSGGLGGADVDAAWTGHLDSNRGQPLASFADMVTQSGGVLTLNQRTATTAERAHLPLNKPIVSAMIHTGLTALGRAPIVFEWLEQRTANTASHMTGWLMQAAGFACDDDLELDWEADSHSDGGGDGKQIRPNINVWNGGVRDNAASSTGSVLSPSQTTTHTYAVKITADGTVEFWLNNTLRRTVTTQKPKAIARSFYALFTNHMYAAATWSGGAAPYVIHWWRLWRTGEHFAPLQAHATIRAAAGANFSSTLATQSALWGSAVTERVEACMMEPNEPGGTTDGIIYGALPSGINYNASTRALSGSSPTPGRLHIVRYVDQAGDTCKPHRIAVEVGPVIATGAFNWTNGQVVNWDVYRDCEVGILTPKVITVTGLPPGVSFSAATGRVTGTPTANGSYTVTVACTNSVGQAASVQRAVSVQTAGAGYAYESWSKLGWFDMSDAANIATTGNEISSIGNRAVPAEPLTINGTAGAWTYESAVQNGRNVARLTRNVSTTAGVPRAVAPVGGPLSAQFAGEDKPYLVIAAYRPLDANTGFIWSASRRTNDTTTQQVALVRRDPANATPVSSIRRGTTQETRDVNFGAGQAANAWRVVATLHTGTAVTIYDNSTTPIVLDAAQDAGIFADEMLFRLGAAENLGSSQGLFATTQCNTDYGEVIVTDGSQTKAAVAQAVTNLAAKWGVTLS